MVNVGVTCPTGALQEKKLTKEKCTFFKKKLLSLHVHIARSWMQNRIKDIWKSSYKIKNQIKEGHVNEGLDMR